MAVLIIRFLPLMWGILLCPVGGRLGIDAFAPLRTTSVQPGVLACTGNNAADKPRELLNVVRSSTHTVGLVLEATRAKPTQSRRFSENAEGPLYVNDKCINCAACSMFAPSTFVRESTSDTHHIVAKQPSSEREIEESRAALAACPVSAIRVEKPTNEKEWIPRTDEFAIHPRANGRPLPFPKQVSPNLPDVYFVGHHNHKSFGAAPYLVSSSSKTTSETQAWIMVDTPRYSELAVRAVESVTGPNGPSYLVLTHVDDTADHNRWKARYPNMKRIFHAGDLGEHNWVGDKSLEDVEILLESRSSEHRLQYFALNGNPIDGNPCEDHADDVVLVHTPGHSPGSIALLKRPTQASQSKSADPGVLFSGDTYSYTTREGGHMSGFPQFGNDPELQSKILPLLLNLNWQVLAPGHGHVRDYTLMGDDVAGDARKQEMEAAIDELSEYF